MGEAQHEKEQARRVVVRRCPYCHDDVSTSDASAVTLCASCHATHHQACWGESGACGACGALVRMETVREALTPALAERLLTEAGYPVAQVKGILRPRSPVLLGLCVAITLILGGLAASLGARGLRVERERDAVVRGLRASQQDLLRQQKELQELRQLAGEVERWQGQPIPSSIVAAPDAVAFANGGQDGLLKVFLGDEARPGHFQASAQPGRIVHSRLVVLQPGHEGLVPVTQGHVQVGDGPLIPFTSQGGDVFVYEHGQLRKLPPRASSAR